MTVKELSDRLSVDFNILSREMEQSDSPSSKLMSAVADELSVPSFIFFMSAPPELDLLLPDFRNAKPQKTAKRRRTVEAIQLAHSVQRGAAISGANGRDPLPFMTALSEDSIEQYALKVRKYFGIDVEIQKKAKDAKAFYNVCRKNIEDKGIFVIHQSFPSEDGSGFCLYDDSHPVIVVNTNRQNRARRLFTLVHELCHVLLKSSGISDPFVRKNSLERKCNNFAGAFLAPREFVESIVPVHNISPSSDPEFIRLVARKLRISQEATVLRLELLGFVREGSHRAWLKQFAGNNPDFSDKGGGGNGEPPPQEKVKLAKYGFNFARVFKYALDKNTIHPVDLYRISGLKPAYQRKYFDYAGSLGRDQLLNLELDDE